MFDGVKTGVLGFALDTRVSNLFDLPSTIGPGGFSFFNGRNGTAHNE
jgi:hypothetical protein